MKLETCHPEGSGGMTGVLESAPVSARGGYDWSAERSTARDTARSFEPDNEYDNPGIQKVIWKIRFEYSRPLTISSLARECGMSVRSLHRLYRSATGNTIGKDLIARRIQAAAAMLCEDDAKLEPVAMETGLRNAKNLCRLFKEHMGLTPGQWKDSFHRRTAGNPWPSAGTLKSQ